MPERPHSIRRLLLLNLAVAGVYIALAMQAKLAFAWEAIAVTLWLPAGLANGAVLLYGPAVAPAVAVANLIGSACNPTGTCMADPWFIPIGLAAGGQAVLVSAVLHRQRLLHDSLSRIPRLLRFLLWAGPAGCWPAAATYAVSVVASGAIPDVASASQPLASLACVWQDTLALQAPTSPPQAASLSMRHFLIVRVEVLHKTHLNVFPCCFTSSSCCISCSCCCISCVALSLCSAAASFNRPFSAKAVCSDNVAAAASACADAAAAKASSSWLRVITSCCSKECVVVCA